MIAVRSTGCARLVVWAALVGWSAASCQPSRLTRPSAARPALLAPAPLTPEQEQASRHLYATLRKAAASGDRAGSAAMQATLLERYPGSEAAACIHEAKASKAKQAGAYAEALAELEHILRGRPQFARIAAVERDYALCLVGAERHQAALDFALAGPSGRPAEEAREARRSVCRALVEPLILAKQPELALEALVAAQPEGGPAAAQAQAFRTQALALLPLVADEQIGTLYRVHAQQAAWQPLRADLALRLAKSPLLVADEVDQVKLLKTVVASASEPAMAEEASRLLSQANLRHEVDPHTIGVLLPLTGRFTQFGERARAAIELALADRKDLTVVYKDTAGDANLAAHAVEELVYDCHAIGAIGPMFSAEAVAAAQRAEALGLPLLSLSHQEGLTSAGPTIFRTGLTVPAQAKALAKVAFEQLNMRSFAMLAPQSRYGNDFLQAFWDEVDSRGGSIRGVEFYAPDATTFRQPIRKLIGRWYLNARPEFRDAYKALKEQNLSGVKLRSEVEKLDKKTRPVIDFDALIIPDSGRQLGLIAPALAFEDIAVSRDEKMLDKMRRTLNQNDITPISLLGASPWNSQQTLDNCEVYCERAVFVDAFFAGAAAGPSKSFAAAYFDKTGRQPTLAEAQAFDSAGLLSTVLQGRRWPQRRSGVIAELHAIERYPGACGPTSFDANGDSVRELQALTIYNHHIVPLAEAPPWPSSPARPQAAARARLPVPAS